MKKKYPQGKGKVKITVTIDNDVIEQLDKHIQDIDAYNRSAVVEEMIKIQIQQDKNLK